MVFRFAVCLLSIAGFAVAGDQPQWGERHSRNVVSGETGLAAEFDLAAESHILWSAALGGGSYSAPVIAEGKVFIGSDNSEPRDPRHQGDRAVMLCLDETDGHFLWQLVVPHIGGDNYLDWPGVGMCSAPTIENGLAYMLTNRCEAICIDLDGFADGNDGPYMDEGRHMSPTDQPMEPGPADADIVWLFDLRTGIGMYPHDSAHTSILLDGDCLYLNTCNGVDNTHAVVRCPDAPSLIALNKKTGALVAKDAEGIGHRIFHSTWSPPSLGEVNGQRLIFFGGADGVCYAFKALAPKLPESAQTFERVWLFDCDPAAPKEDIHSYLKNTREGPSEIVGSPVFYNNRIYVAGGGDVWWGKREAWLKCIDASQTGDVTTSAELWSYPLGRHCFSTPAIDSGLLFIPDCAGNLHCLDAGTGQMYWTHDLGREVWGSALAADGKVYTGTRDGAFAVLAADKTKKVLFTAQFDDEINHTPVAANKVLYIPTLSRLYAVK